MVELQIAQQFARMDMQIRNADFTLKQTRPDLQVSQKPAELTVQISAADLKIDYKPMLESLGYGNVDYVARMNTQAAQNEYLANLEKRVQIGNRIGDIENGLTMGQIITEFTEPQYSDLQLMPLVPIRISYEQGNIDFRSQLGEVKSKLNYGRVYIEDFTFPSVKVTLAKTPYIKVSAVGQAFDTGK